MLRRSLKKPLSYRDALTVLGADENRAVAILGRIAGMAAAAISVSTVGALSFFDVRDEAVEWGKTMMSSLEGRIAGISRLDRTERIVSAHAIIVISSFYDALTDCAASIVDAAITAAEQAAIATTTPLRESYGQLIASLVDSEIPLPSPDTPFEQVLDNLDYYYRNIHSSLNTFLGGLTAFEGRDDIFKSNAYSKLPQHAVKNYIANFRRLAADVPEFAFWASMTDSEATRAALGMLAADLHTRLDQLGTGLYGVQELLTAVSANQNADVWRRELSQSYRQYLDKPILDSREAPDGVVLPPLGKAYVNPACRIAADAHRVQANLATESWWDDAPAVSDIQAFLVGHLTSPQATRAPLVVLGQPGSGKSVLTRLLAASLPESDFLTIRVELRAVAADADIRDQIRNAVYSAIDRNVDWPDLVAAAPGALPVVMLDGFDELLQATGVNQADYLERVRNFQERESELGRPVAVVVTSRTVVADRARFPAGSIAVRLEPFDEARVQRWLKVWAAFNTDVLQARNLRPLSAEAALAQGVLAGEPLLLLLLALYDAGSNALQSRASALSRAELYEMLLTEFALREVRKHQPNLPAEEERFAVERELLHLSVAALAIFNRGRQIITEAELNEDLAALSVGDLVAGNPVGMNRPLTAAQTVVGRFFFVHEPTARRDTGAIERSFEFLHATFGEFLVARMVVNTVLDLVSDRAYQMQRPNPVSLDAGFLYAATSFELLSSRVPTVEFCRGLFSMQKDSIRIACRSLLVDLLRDALYAHQQWRYADYQPARTPLPRRCAAFSANLLLLAVFAYNEGISIEKEVMASGESPSMDWQSLATLWRSQLPNAETLALTLRARWQASENGTTESTLSLDMRKVDLWLDVEDDSPALLSESTRRIYEFEIKYDDANGDLTRWSYGDLSVEPRSAIGFEFRRMAFFESTSNIEGVIPYWRHAGIYLHYISGPPLDGSIQQIFLDLALSPPDSMTSQQRSHIYRILVTVGWGLKQDEILFKLLLGDLRYISLEDAASILEAAYDEDRPSGRALPDGFFTVVAEFARASVSPSSDYHPVVMRICRTIDMREDASTRPAERMRAAFASAGIKYPSFPQPRSTKSSVNQSANSQRKRQQPSPADASTQHPTSSRSHQAAPDSTT